MQIYYCSLLKDRLSMLHLLPLPIVKKRWGSGLLLGTWSSFTLKNADDIWTILVSNTGKACFFHGLHANVTLCRTLLSCVDIVGDLCREWPERSLFNSYDTEVNPWSPGTYRAIAQMSRVFVNSPRSSHTKDSKNGTWCSLD